MSNRWERSGHEQGSHPEIHSLDDLFGYMSSLATAPRLTGTGHYDAKLVPAGSGSRVHPVEIPRDDNSGKIYLLYHEVGGRAVASVMWSYSDMQQAQSFGYFHLAHDATGWSYEFASELSGSPEQSVTWLEDIPEEVRNAALAELDTIWYWRPEQAASSLELDEPEDLLAA